MPQVNQVNQVNHVWSSQNAMVFLASQDLDPELQYEAGFPAWENEKEKRAGRVVWRDFMEPGMVLEVLGLPIDPYRTWGFKIVKGNIARGNHGVHLQN